MHTYNCLWFQNSFTLQTAVDHDVNVCCICIMYFPNFPTGWYTYPAQTDCGSEGQSFEKLRQFLLSYLTSSNFVYSPFPLPVNVTASLTFKSDFYFSFQGRCNREKPPCKYFHPPQHLKDQLLINGRNHLALKNALMQQMGISPGQQLVTGQVPTVVSQTLLWACTFNVTH